MVKNKEYFLRKNEVKMVNLCVLLSVFDLILSIKLVFQLLQCILSSERSSKLDIIRYEILILYYLWDNL